MKRTACCTLGLLAITTSNLLGQYFGRNQVQYRTFDFSVIETEHFDVYYYDDVRAAALDAARMAERGYGRLSRLLNHQYRERQPLILFGSHSEFQQNNLTEIGEGVQGVTDPLRHRVMLPFTGSYADFDHVLQHELVHQFQFDIFARGFVGAGVPQLLALQPPLWFMEGMAEYLSVGPIDALTAMWLRDAVARGTLPTVEELTRDPNIFPYRFGHALMAYIGDRWGDDVIAEVLHGAASGGIEFGLQRALGIPMAQLSVEWHTAVAEEYLPRADVAALPTEAHPLLTEPRSKGRLHVAPALSPDGRQVVYFSEGGSLFIDMYLADAATGRIERRLVKGAFSGDFESLRFINSGGAWSPDGGHFAFPAKRGGRDDLVIVEMPSGRVHTRIRIDVAGITNPDWSPDGRRLVFTGLVNGVSDLFTVDVDGAQLDRLTNDRYADLHPSWSPDGETIAFATDRGGETDLDRLDVGDLGLALYHLDGHRIEVLPEMEGTNVDPQWAPDGRSIAFISDRTGTTNVFLYDLDDTRQYRLTDVFTGVSGITAVSPALSWARDADRLAFTYYEDGAYNVYAVDDPRRLRGAPYRPSVEPLIAGEPLATTLIQGGVVADSGAQLLYPLPSPTPRERGFDDFRRRARFRRVSVRALLDSATLALVDTTEFTFRRYSPRLHLDYAIQPSLGYVRDNFGGGVFGGTAVALSDILGNRRVLLGGAVNGRIEEAQIAAVYANLSHRTNWVVGYRQTPYFYFTGVDLVTDAEQNQQVLNQRLDRFIVHTAFVEAHRPFNRFHRLEYKINATNVSRAALTFQTFFDPATGFIRDRDLTKTGLGSVNYVQPSVALVYDNSISLWTGPFLGRRTRVEYAPAFGGWQFHQGLADLRRYDRLVGPFTLASRALFFGRFGGDSESFPLFLGTPDLVRGYTSGSLRRGECEAVEGRLGACRALSQLVGSRIAVANLELRFPLFNQFGIRILPSYFPPIDGALFFDAGMAWQDGSTLTLRGSAGEETEDVRHPLASWGFSLRSNIFGVMILRGDFTKPLSRNGHPPYWTLSIGPTF